MEPVVETLSHMILKAAQRSIENYFINAHILLSGVLTDILQWLGLGPKLQPQPVPVRK